MSDNTSDRLFEEFPPVSTAEWMAAIEHDLKGADLEKAMVWHSVEGLDVRPFYRREDLEGQSDALAAGPGQYPFRRGTTEKAGGWIVRQDITRTDPVEANQAARQALERGAQSVAFVARAMGAGVVGVVVNEPDDFRRLLTDLVGTTRVHFGTGPLTSAWLDCLPDDLASHLVGSLDYDPIGEIATSAMPYLGADELGAQMKAHLALAKAKAPHMRAIHVGASEVHEAGGNAVQELAFSLAKATDCLDVLGAEAAATMTATFSVGTSYFMEIAKLRAARILWAKMLTTFGLDPAACHVPFHARTSNWNQTVYDPFANMLRATTEVMAAAIANVDTISVDPFDFAFRRPDDFSERIARNVQLILGEEAGVGHVRDVAGGSYYVETLTQRLADEAWKLFQVIEKQGGLLRALEAGWVQQEIHRVREVKDAMIAHRRMGLVGTSQYPNLQETALDRLDLPVPTPCALLQPWPAGGTMVAPVARYRAAEPFEQIRLATESFVKAGGRRPTIFLLVTGHSAMRRARANFAANFFGCAGFEIAEPAAIKTVAEGVSAAKLARADVIVLCSSDPEYATLGPEMVQEARGAGIRVPLVIAGNPKDSMDALKEAGIDDFIHARSDAVETLRRYQEALCR